VLEVHGCWSFRRKETPGNGLPEPLIVASS
jgi:hypothetical protein